MATGSYPAANSPATADRERYIERQINATRRQVKFVEIGVGLVSLVVGVLAYFFVMALIDHWLMPLGVWGRAAALTTLVIGAAWYFVAVIWPALRNSINPAYAALTIENSTPTLKNSLINFLMLRSQRGGVHDVVFEAVEARAANDLKQVSIDAVIDYSKLIKIGYVLAGLFAVLAAYNILSPKDPLQTVARVAAPWADIAQPSRVQIEEVTPGDAEKFFGDTVEISALVRGARASDRLELVYSTIDGQIVDKAVPLALDASGLKYVAKLPVDGQGLQQDLIYRLTAGDAVTRDYKLHVLASPTIVVEKLTYDFPRYTQKPQQAHERIGDIRALEGTKVTIEAKANQPISAAYIEFDPGQADDSPESALKRQRVPMTASGHDATSSFVLELAGDRSTPKFGTYQITFMTSGGFPGKNPALHTIDIVRDLPPEVEILTPVEQLTAVPVNGQQAIEVRAVDADFSLSRVSLKVTRAAHDLAEEILLNSATGHQGQWVGKFKFRPQEYKLQPGDEVVLWAVAADNRTSAKSNVAEANVERTKNYVFKIGAPTAQAEAEKNQVDQEQDPMPGDEGNEGNEDKQPKEGDQPQNAGKEGEGSQEGDEGQAGKQGEKKEGEGKEGGEQSEAGSKKNGKKNEKPNKSKTEQSGEKSEQGGAEKNKDDEGGKADKPSTGGGQNGEGQQEQKNDANQNGKKNEKKQPGGKEGEGESKPQPGEQNQNKKKNGGAGKEGEQSQPEQNGGKPDKQPPGASNKNDNEKSTKPEDQSEAGATNGQAGSEAGKADTPMTGGSGKSDQNDKSKNGGMGQGSEAGGNAQGGGSQQSPPGQKNGQTGGSKEGQPQGGEQGQKAEGSQAGETSKQKGGRGEKSQAGNKLPEGPKEKAHEGEAVEKILERIKEQAQNQEQGGGQGAQPQPGAEKLDDDLAKKAREFLEKQKQQQAGKAGGEQTDKPSGESEAGEQPGKSSKPSGADKKQGSGANNERGQGETGKPDETAKTKPEEKTGEGATSDKESQGGMGHTGTSGAGQENKEKKGSVQSQQEQSQDRAKESKPDNQKGSEGQEAQSPSGSKKQSDSKGGKEGGDRSGGGGQGGGQPAKAAGNDTPGSTSAAEQGAGAASEKGMGETGTKGGDQQKSDKPTGQSGGKEKGPGSKTQQDPNGDQKGSGETTGEDGRQPMEKPEKPDGSFTGAKAGAKGPVTGGGLPSDEQSSDNSQDDLQAPAAEKAKIDYAREATDLVLEYLKDQKEQPNQELLDELGWTKEDLNQFLSRWESAKREAVANPKSKGDLDEALRSLGLRPQGDKLRRGDVKSDNVRGLGDVGSQSGPPSKYAEQFRAFKKGAARGK